MWNVSVVIPVFNSEGILRDLCQRLKAVLDEVSDDYEIIMVEDGSEDGSWQVIEQLARENALIRGFRLGRNYGQHNALLCGIRAASYEVIITMDDDLQHPPEEISKLLDKLAEGYDVVYGSPREERHGLSRDLASRATKMALQAAMGVKTARNASAFRVFRTQLRSAFIDYQSPSVSIDVLLSWATTRFAFVLVRHESRQVGKSNYTFQKLVVHALNMLTGFSVLPLRLASLLGFFFTIFGMGVLAYVVGRYLIQGSGVPGFPFLASVIAIFSGAQLFALGIMGEYMARIYFRTISRPPYSVRLTTENVEVGGMANQAARAEDRSGHD